MKKIRVFAPASIGNLSVGFDALGLALWPLDGTLLGDVVTLEAGGLTQRRQVNGQSGSIGEGPDTLHFGVGSAQAIDRLVVRWPGGETQTVAGPWPAGERIVVEQP